jgi:ATP synthase protein I
MSGGNGGEGDGKRKHAGSGRQQAEGKAAPEELAGRLSNLGERLGRTRIEAQLKAGGGRSDNAGFGMALRLSTEFVAAILLGAGIGWMIDRFLGIGPWGMIVFLLLGFCAGVLNVLRSAGRMADPHARLGDGNDRSDRN